jgi:exopolyphosphatase/guanosine-5'-triphosphate,3'-diphosphate pyrophosphatase
MIETAFGEADETEVGHHTPHFPLRLAALDIGSNAIRYLAAEFADHRRFAEIESYRFPVRLGHDVFTTGGLLPPAVDAVTECVNTFRRRISDLGIDAYRAVATSALRESSNSAEVIDRIRFETGIDLEAITGGEEARLVWVAVRNRMRLGRGRWLLADLGGGSVEISVITEEAIVATESTRIGAVRLLEEGSAGAKDAAEFRQLVERRVATLELPPGQERPFQGLILTGGNAEALAAVLQARPDRDGVPELAAAQLKAAIDKLLSMSVAERIEIFGMRPDRADVIVPATIIFDRIAELAGVRTVHIPCVGVKEGLLVDLASTVVPGRSAKGG